MPALLRAVDADSGRADGVLAALAEAISGVLAALVALTDPQLVVVGGTWGSHPAVLQAVSDRSARLPRPVPLRPAQVIAEPALAGARDDALRDLRAAILNQQQAADRQSPSRSRWGSSPQSAGERARPAPVPLRP